jgi:hypothetical protein
MIPTSLNNPITPNMTLAELLRALPELSRFLDDLKRLAQQAAGLEVDPSSGLEINTTNGTQIIRANPDNFNNSTVAYVNTQDTTNYPVFANEKVKSFTIDGTNGLTSIVTASNDTIGILAATPTINGIVTTTTQSFAGYKIFGTGIEVNDYSGSYDNYFTHAVFKKAGATYTAGKIRTNYHNSSSLGTFEIQVPDVQQSLYDAAWIGRLNFGKWSSGTLTNEVRLESANNLYLTAFDYANSNLGASFLKIIGTTTGTSFSFQHYAYNQSPTEIATIDYIGDFACIGSVTCQAYFVKTSETLYRGGSGTDSIGNVFVNGIVTTIGSGTVGNGTVTSVALSMPSIFTVSGSPVTTSGTLTASLATQSANTVFAGPASGSAASPTFRSLVAADMPLATTSAFGAVKPDGTTITISGGVISAASGGGTVTSVGLSMPSIFSVSYSPVTTTGVLTAYLVQQNANYFFAGPVSGGAASPGFRAINYADLPLSSDTHVGAVKPDGSTTSVSNGAMSTVGYSGTFTTSAGTLTFFKGLLQNATGSGWSSSS